jgi:hypothetical protein
MDMKLIYLYKIKDFLKNSEKAHNYCEETWYSCPKSDEGCANDEEGENCNCGAEKYNMQLVSILSMLNDIIEDEEKK